MFRAPLFRDRRSVCRAPEIGTPYGVTHTHFAIVPRSALGSKSLMILRDKNSPRGRECFGVLFLRLRASAAELDFGARSVGGFKQSLRLPLYAARNARGGGWFAAGHLQ
jgi:hypothetical protein